MAIDQLDQDTARKRLLSMPPEQRTHVLKQYGDWRHTVRHILINDMAAEHYGKRFHCHAAAMLELALERLAKIIV